MNPTYRKKEKRDREKSRTWHSEGPETRGQERIRGGGRGREKRKLEENTGDHEANAEGQNAGPSKDRKKKPRTLKPRQVLNAGLIA